MATRKLARRTRERRAKLFMNGRSQAVRLPKDFRFDGREVLIRREGDAVVLEPVRSGGWPRGFWEKLGRLSEDFAAPSPLPPGETVVDFDAP